MCVFLHEICEKNNKLNQQTAMYLHIIEIICVGFGLAWPTSSTGNYTEKLISNGDLSLREKKKFLEVF